MDALDPATEWRRLSELYGRLSDGELLGLARQKSELTDVAQEALNSEISQRKLKVQPEAPAPSPVPETPPDSPYADDRRLVEIATVWSLADALQLQRLLDVAGIPFFMGPEKATGVDSVTSNFANGVSVQVMNIGVPWARQALQNYTPENEPEEEEDNEQQGEPDEHPVRCPKCHSTEVILDDLVSEPSDVPTDSAPQFEWTCDSCGHRWKDDGIVRED
jgi:hypothetical protein